MKKARLPSLPLATLTAIVTTIMLLLSVGLTYLGVISYANHLEQGITDALPPKAAATYKMLSDNKVPDGDSLKFLVENLISMNEPTDFQVQLSVLVFGLLSALLCAVIGVFLARRLTRPLEELTFAAEGLKSGDFSVRVAAHYHSTREVSSLVGTFNALATSLETMEERLRFNNMAVAHELRTPLTILQGSLQSMIDGVFPMDRKIISDLLLQVEGLGRVVEDLRTLSLAIGQKLVMERQRIDASQLVETVIASAKPMLEATKLRVETGLKPVWISADSPRIRQAVLALLENACRYAGEGGWLRCETEQLADNSVVIRVLDRGPGFPQDMDSVAVNPFWRGDPSRARATGGTGLGLSVVQAIAVAHGGHLEFANRPEGGAMVTIHLMDNGVPGETHGFAPQDATHRQCRLC
ncbi:MULTISPECIES: ATP-binding protein [unclassified Rhizobium]|jgi:two-component system sensor histidine kinase AdeS|uniref:ATP-binding protein n=1 Tax=unclassified Rhizobium TaxID=2613769 RepID=UPI0006489737|nr:MULTISPECIES: ATP-binding protein [unclassified Rhizobium]MBN8952974.1 HAMP domain-containing protein [Rhizobium tropici]OJY64694.1 MAG: two-component sensor histidine kinase [Rhizobium sp. 60-20]RKD72439.1 two-component system sensor histidine kinase AdeS [Rhizobium sp. WW_1]